MQQQCQADLTNVLCFAVLAALSSSPVSLLLSAHWSLPTELILGEGKRERERAGRGSERANFLSLNTSPSLVGLHSHLLLCEMSPTHSAAPQHCDLKPLKWDASRERGKVTDRKGVGDPSLDGVGVGKGGGAGSGLVGNCSGQTFGC